MLHDGSELNVFFPAGSVPEAIRKTLKGAVDPRKLGSILINYGFNERSASFIEYPTSENGFPFIGTPYIRRKHFRMAAHVCHYIFAAIVTVQEVKHPASRAF